MLPLQQPPQYHIIGDVYVDILCYIPSNDGSNNSSKNKNQTITPPVLKLDGTDTALTQPITIMAGGSTINTATYLQYLQRLQSSSPLSLQQLPSVSLLPSSLLDITVHTVFNPNDYYGSILLQHAKANQITLENGCNDMFLMNSSKEESSSPLSSSSLQPQRNLSTPHCMVMISSSTTTTAAATTTTAATAVAAAATANTTTTTISSERTFLTHRGCATDNMYIENLFPSSSVLSSTSTSTTGCNSLPRHYHIAGYYCTPEFWTTNGTTDTTQNSLSLLVKNRSEERRVGKECRP